MTSVTQRTGAMPKTDFRFGANCLLELEGHEPQAVKANVGKKHRILAHLGQAPYGTHLHISPSDLHDSSMKNRWIVHAVTTQ